MLIDYALATCANDIYTTIDTDIEHVNYDVNGEQFSLFYDDKTIVLAIRGSDEAIDWIRNVNLQPIYLDLPNMGWVAVHKGFKAGASLIARTCDKLVRELMIDRKLYITGHSRGGAVAALLPLVWHNITPTRITTFGAPAFMKDGFGSLYDEHIYPHLIRYVNDMDAVPAHPVKYEQAGIVRYVTPQGIRTSKRLFSDMRRAIRSIFGGYMARQHDMTLYLAWLKKVIDG